VQASLVKTDKPGEDQSVAPGIELRDWIKAKIEAQRIKAKIEAQKKDGIENSMSVGDKTHRTEHTGRRGRMPSGRPGLRGRRLFYDFGDG
jgi:hypothetical protein